MMRDRIKVITCIRVKASLVVELAASPDAFIAALLLDLLLYTRYPL